MPSERLRKLEIDANHAFDQYRELYFEGGVSSVYLWDLDHGFAAVILIKKAGDGSKKIKGCWDSIHVVEVQEKSTGRTAHYKLTSTAMLWLQTNKHGSGTMNLGGSLTRQVSFSNKFSLLPPLVQLKIQFMSRQLKENPAYLHFAYNRRWNKTLKSAKRPLILPTLAEWWRTWRTRSVIR